VNIIGVQLDIAWEDKAANFEKVGRLLQQAAAEPASLVVLPEMFATGFTMNTAAMAEPYDGQTEQFLKQLAKEHRAYVVAGAAMRTQDGQARNKALVLGPAGELIGYYSKMRPFAPGGEAQHYSPGHRPVAIECAGIKLAPFICYDLRFPELFRQIAAAHRPQLFVVIASWPEKRVSPWIRLLQARAIENQAYVVGINRVGTDPYYAYPGRSLIVDFNGDILADGGAAEGVVRAQLDFDPLTKYRQGLPFLDDLEL
jgi:predicted amidohydrolase